MKFKKIKLKVEMIFLLFSIIFGLLWMVILPPFQAPDEGSHFFRSYMIADGQLMCQNVNGSNAGAYIPATLKELGNAIGGGKIIFHPEVRQDPNLIKKAFNIKVSKQKQFAVIPNTCVYSPAPYIPQSLGIIVGKIFNSPALGLFYLGRFFNLLFYIAICFIAIKIIPKFKGTLALLALTPMAIHQAASMSADGITISSSFLLIAYIFYLASREKINNKQLILLAIIGMVVTLCKIVYFPIVWLYFIIPYKLIGSKKKYILSGLAICGISLFTFAAWMLLVRTVHVIFPVDPKTQLEIILANPLAFAHKLVHTLLTQAGNYYDQFFGVFGWLDTPMPSLLALGFLIALTISAYIGGVEDAVGKPAETVNLLKGLWLLFIFALIVILIEVTLFLNFSKPNLSIIQGVQGRYFIPISFLFFSSLSFLKQSIKKYWYPIIFIGGIFMFIICSYFLYSRYYG